MFCDGGMSQTGFDKKMFFMYLEDGKMKGRGGELSQNQENTEKGLTWKHFQEEKGNLAIRLELCVPSLHKDHANLSCIIPILFTS